MLGDLIIDKIEKFFHYICFEPNPIVMILYLLLAVVGFIVYVRDGFALLPCVYASNVHKYTGSALMIACYKSFYSACTVNPGYILKSNHKQAIKRFEFDNVMYYAKN